MTTVLAPLEILKSVRFGLVQCIVLVEMAIKMLKVFTRCILSLVLVCTHLPFFFLTLLWSCSSVLSSNRCNAYAKDPCFASCDCMSERYDPVCGSDGFTYPSPCLAGCQQLENNLGPDGKTDLQHRVSPEKRVDFEVLV